MAFLFFSKFIAFLFLVLQFHNLVFLLLGGCDACENKHQRWSAFMYSEKVVHSAVRRFQRQGNMSWFGWTKKLHFLVEPILIMIGACVCSFRFLCLPHGYLGTMPVFRLNRKAGNNRGANIKFHIISFCLKRVIRHTNDIVYFIIIQSVQ